jgi:hypothetical protein
MQRNMTAIVVIVLLAMTIVGLCVGLWLVL